MKLAATLVKIAKLRVRVEAVPVRDGKVLAGKKHGKTEMYGGAVDPGESKEHAAGRELHEESGYHMKHPHLLDVKPVITHHPPHRHPEYSGTETFFVAGEASADHGRPTHPDPVPITHPGLHKKVEK